MQTGKPKFWFISGGILAFLGVAFLATSIVMKTAFFDSMKRGIYSMRFIDNTHEVDGCKNIVLGDATCSGSRFAAWSMSSNEKYSTCMSSSAPSSSTKLAASKWCSPGSDEGCSKPEICQPGQLFDFHFFSVFNPSEVLQGHPVEMIEMEPVRVRKSIDRVDIDSSLLDSEGTLSYYEAVRFEVADPSYESALDQVIVIPNPAMLSTSLQDHMRISTDTLTYLVAAATFYSNAQKMINEKTAELSRLNINAGQLFEGTFHVNFTSLIKDQYRRGAFSLAMGEFLASPVCPALLPLVSAALNSPMPPEVSVASMCVPAFRGNIGLSVFSSMTKSAGLSTTPSDAAFFYEFEKGCPEHIKYPGNACMLADVCPQPVDSEEYRRCTEPMLSEADADALFNLFNLYLKPGNPEAMQTLMTQCTARGYTIQPQAKCDMVITQLLRVGRMALLSSANPKHKKWFSLYGYDRDNLLDYELGRKVFPYFIKGTIRDLMGYGKDKPTLCPFSGARLGPQGFVNSLHINGTTTDSVFGPVSIKVGSQHGQSGAGTFSSVKGKKHGCTFDYGCIAQETYFNSNGAHCVADENICQPSFVEKGHDAGFFAGNIFGTGSTEFHGLGKRLEMFMPETMMSGVFEQTDSNVMWKNGLKVNKWDLVSIPAMERRNCEDTRPNVSRSVACDSPIGTVDVGRQLALDIPTQFSPISVHPPLIASVPHFNHGTTRIKICKTCPSDRDFQTRMYTEPETGAQVFGSQKIQMNIRMASKISELTRQPGTEGRDFHTGGLFMDENLDVIIPMFWMNRFDQAAPFQAAKLASLQALPRTINILFAVLLALAVILVGTSVWMIHRGKFLQKHAHVSQMTLTRKPSEKTIIPDACISDNEELSSYSQDTSSPKTLSRV